MGKGVAVLVKVSLILSFKRGGEKRVSNLKLQVKAMGMIQDKYERRFLHWNLPRNKQCLFREEVIFEFPLPNLTLHHRCLKSKLE